MTYRLRYEKRVLKDLDRTVLRDVIRIDKTIQSLVTQPFPVGVKKLIGEEKLYRVRQGDYRIIYSVDPKAATISILAVRHRREAYR